MVELIMLISDICQFIGIGCDWVDHLGDCIDVVMLCYYFYMRARAKRTLSDEYVMA